MSNVRKEYGPTWEFNSTIPVIEETTKEVFSYPLSIAAADTKNAQGRFQHALVIHQPAHTKPFMLNEYISLLSKKTNYQIRSSKHINTVKWENCFFFYDGHCWKNCFGQPSGRDHEMPLVNSRGVPCAKCTIVVVSQYANEIASRIRGVHIRQSEVSKNKQGYRNILPKPPVVPSVPPALQMQVMPSLLPISSDSSSSSASASPSVVHIETGPRNITTILQSLMEQHDNVTEDEIKIVLKEIVGDASYDGNESDHDMKESIRNAAKEWCAAKKALQQSQHKLNLACLENAGIKRARRETIIPEIQKAMRYLAK